MLVDMSSGYESRTPYELLLEHYQRVDHPDAFLASLGARRRAEQERFEAHRARLEVYRTLIEAGAN